MKNRQPTKITVGELNKLKEPYPDGRVDTEAVEFKIQDSSGLFGVYNRSTKPPIKLKPEEKNKTKCSIS